MASLMKTIINARRSVTKRPDLGGIVWAWTGLEFMGKPVSNTQTFDSMEEANQIGEELNRGIMKAAFQQSKESDYEGFASRHEIVIQNG